MMKFEYKEKVLSHLESIEKRNTIISEMLAGQRPVNQDEAVKLNNEIKRLVELAENIVDIS